MAVGRRDAVAGYRRVRRRGPAGPADPGSQDYQTAVELYRGELLPEDRFEEWAEGPRETFRERHLGLLVEYAQVLSERGEHTQVVDVASAVTAADPFHEGAHRDPAVAPAPGHSQMDSALLTHEVAIHRSPSTWWR
jgi:hypothetical protein